MSDVTTYGIVAQSAESTVVAEYVSEVARDAGYQSEADLEGQFIELLQEQAYERLSLTVEEDLITNLRRQLEKLNAIEFSDGEWERFFTHVIAPANEGIVEKTRKIQEDYVQTLRRDDGTTKNVRLIDKDNIHNNSLQVVNQYETGAGARENRYDVTILVNGLPLVHVELKRRGVALKEAFNQIERYQRDSFWAGAGLFQWVQIFVISNGTHTKYYANTTRLKHVSTDRRGPKVGDTFEFTMWWADAKNMPIQDLVDFTKTFFAKHTLLAVLTRYCVFNSENDLMVMRPYQIVATEAILKRIEVSNNYRHDPARKPGTLGAGGYIWHTTGSGKTLTSFKTAQLATRLNYLDKVLFVVDRQDLDFKTMRDFELYQKDAVTGSTSTAKLREALENPAARIVVTTIQKLSVFIAKNPGHAVYDQHVAIVFDECHRSQFGDMHTAITRAFKNYHLFGFTGTPIFATNAGPGGGQQMRTTQQAFGDRLHTYTIVDAIRDKTVLAFKIDYVSTAREAEEEDGEGGAGAGGSGNTLVSDIDREKALLDPQRIAGVTRYIIDHFDQKTKRGTVYRVKGGHRSGFNSILATASIDAAKAYYAEFARQQHNLKVGLIYSFAVNEETPEGLLAEEDFETSGLDASSRDFLDAAIADYNTMFGASFDTGADKFGSYHKDVSRRLESRELDLLIVVNMFLTGFDAKTLNTLWVDKKLQHHGLIQAFSRTNRILNSVKTFGQIVCFRNLEKATNDAVALFGDSEASGLVVLRPYDEYYKEYLARVTELLSLFPLGIRPDDEKGFINLYGAILRLRNILTSFDEFTIDEWGLSERQLQDYQSLYLDLWAEHRKITDGDKEDINDDLVFEIELVKQVAIDLAAILALVQTYHDNNCADKEIPVAISKSIDSSPDLRKKKDLIEKFLATLAPGADVDGAWAAFIAEAKARELAAIIESERLNAEATQEFMTNALRDGSLPTTGTAVMRILPPVSRFAADNSHSQVKARVMGKLRTYFDRYSEA
ncbi:MAG: type I restriction endonuclease subunit R [Propionibacteriaceae bacterium]|jgi:type I restriction enzyme R subunit|nr:type I restriction endonuclease subunit R [Propionibacteriaceae bacterium]